MRAILVALSMLAVVLAGCVGATDDDLTTPGPEPSDGPDGVVAFRSADNGTSPMPLDPERLGVPWSKETGFGGGEPTMAITPTGAIFGAAGSAGIRSTDGGESWEEVIRVGLPVRSPADSVYRSWDPLMWYDKWTERVYFDPMFPPLACTELSWTTDDGETWTTNPAVCHVPPMDHQKLFSGPPGPDAPAFAGVAHPTVLYQCYNQIVSTNCVMSYDGGLTWAVTTSVANNVRDGCGGTNGHGTVSEKGIAVVPMGTSCGDMTLGVSRDSGLTWELVTVPGEDGTFGFDFDVVFDEDEMLYVLFEGDDYQMHFARSPDYGQTWEGPYTVTPPGVASVFFQTMNVGTDGKLAMAFLGTPTHAGNPNEAPEETHWHLYILTTKDRLSGTPEFVAYQVTPESDPVHVGQICTGGIGCTGGRELLEFIDSAISPDGTFHVIYTDSCTGDCAAKGNQTEADKGGRQIALARLDGWSLLDAAETVASVTEGSGPAVAGVG